jgi:hypothetical protein
MPLTFFSHQAPVLPLKLLAPRWFDGTALVVSSMAPDLAFVVNGTGLQVDAHRLSAQLWLCLPVTVALTWLIKRVVAAPLAAVLPREGPLHLHDYGRLAQWRFPRRPVSWMILLASALVGSLSHLVIDSFTHGFGWAVARIPLLQTELFVLPSAWSGRAIHVYDLGQLVGTVVGAGITGWCLCRVGTKRLLTRWYPEPPPVPTNALAEAWRHLGACTAAGAAFGLAAALTLLATGGPQAFIMRTAGFTFLGLVVGCVTTRTRASGAGAPITNAAARSTGT